MDPPIATEFCAAPITTRGRPQHQVDAILRDNPHIHFGDSTSAATSSST
jgi:hypothetical protein